MPNCNVPDCYEPTVARNVCNKHYIQWKRIQGDIEAILPYVKVITTPIKACNHPRVGENLINYKIRGRYIGTRCRQCWTALKRAWHLKKKQKKEETT